MRFRLGLLTVLSLLSVSALAHAGGIGAEGVKDGSYSGELSGGNDVDFKVNKGNFRDFETKVPASCDDGDRNVRVIFPPAGWDGPDGVAIEDQRVRIVFKGNPNVPLRKSKRVIAVKFGQDTFTGVVKLRGGCEADDTFAGPMR